MHTLTCYADGPPKLLDFSQSLDLSVVQPILPPPPHQWMSQGLKVQGSEFDLLQVCVDRIWFKATPDSRE